MTRAPVALVVAALVTMTTASAPPAHAQPTRQPNAAEIAKRLQRLSVLGTVLYVAAHPDDENTALLAYLANGRLVRTGYLSITRGDGGQNLIGSEQGVALGVIRTQELLAARRIDGAEQMFTRARDFGFSKSVQETLTLWGEDEILGDVVSAIRRFRPDVIVTRFSPNGGGHGHHTASAQLAGRAFQAAADDKYQPAGQPKLPPWQARRLLVNRGPGDLDSPVRVDVGTYDPLLGQSFGEIAGASRSMHKSQGFGALQRRGPQIEAFDVTAQAPKEKPSGANPFEGLDWSWSRIPGSERAARLSADAVRNFRTDNPAAILPILTALDAALESLSDAHWRAIKRQEVAALAAACAGLSIEAVADAPTAVAGTAIKVVVTAINRSAAPIKLRGLRFVGPALAATPAVASSVERPLAKHTPLAVEQSLVIPAGAPASGPHWLAQAPLPGRFVPSAAGTAAAAYAPAGFSGAPENLPAVSVEAQITIHDRPFVLSYPVRHKWLDPVEGERQRPLEIVPAVSLIPETTTLLFPDGKAQPLIVRVAAQAPNAKGTVRLQLPPGFAAQPEGAPFALAAAGDEASVTFTVQAPAAAAAAPPPRTTGTPAARVLAAPATLRVVAQVDAGAGVAVATNAPPLLDRVDHISHGHIPVQLLLTPAEVHLVPIDLRREGKRIGYIAGAGDDVPAALARAGYQVEFLDVAALGTLPLAGFDAIVTGVRAFNTHARLLAERPRLLDYVKAGGALIVQYNTNNRLASVEGQIGPLPFDISRDRVTDESAAVTFALPTHPILTFPNRITPADFAGWVQERGLYFATGWDKGYDAPLEMADAGEAAHRGSLIVTRHGRGAFIYTGLSFFRQLPAGVPGAFRLFANLVGHGHARP